MNQDQQQFFEDVVFQSTGIKETIISSMSLSGGCINNALKLETRSGKVFCLKYNESADISMFETEAKGLNVLKEAEEINIPEVIGFGKVNNVTFILLEFIESKSQSKNYWESFGLGLANLHRHSQPNFGLSFNNYIGSLHQNNSYYEDWLNFFISKRLKPQFDLAIKSGLIAHHYQDKLEKLAIRLENFFPNEKPALLHGDLWSGNIMTDNQGAPCIIDPATYYGHREIEIAFTKLFGGFDQRFYLSYNEVFPLETGFSERMDVYNMYPLMVHVNLFGTGYMRGVDTVFRKFI